jgi:hypothetical protein
VVSYQQRALPAGATAYTLAARSIVLLQASV